MVDALVLWARDYKVDGFRFDLMGFHTKANLRLVRENLDALTLEQDGTDGKGIYLYGEGWKFGSLCDSHLTKPVRSLISTEPASGPSATAFGIAARGGQSQRARQNRAVALSTGTLVRRQRHLRRRAAAAAHPALRGRFATQPSGNLRDYRLINSIGQNLSGAEIIYKAAPPATPRARRKPSTSSPITTITISGIISPPRRRFTNQSATRPVRRSTNAYACTGSDSAWWRSRQGIPFFHAGSDFLRSKSGGQQQLQFRRLVQPPGFHAHRQQLGRGLPPGENIKDWDFWAPRLRDRISSLSASDLRETAAYFPRAAGIRRTSPLFRLSTADDVSARVQFPRSRAGPSPVSRIPLHGACATISTACPSSTRYTI